MALKTASPAAPFEDLTWQDRGQINCNPGLCLARCSVPWDTPESQMTGASRPRRWQRDSLLPTLAQPRHGPKTCRSTDQPGQALAWRIRDDELWLLLSSMDCCADRPLRQPSRNLVSRFH